MRDAPDGKEHPLDALVCATGFQAAEAVSPFEIRGRGGRDLNEEWKGGAEAYLGTTVAGFPNLFLLIGPNTGLGHNSMVFMIESQVAYVLDAIRTMHERRLRHVEVRPRRADALQRHAQGAPREDRLEHRRMQGLVHDARRQEHDDLAGLHLRVPPPHAPLRSRAL